MINQSIKKCDITSAVDASEDNMSCSSLRIFFHRSLMMKIKEYDRDYSISSVLNALSAGLDSLPGKQLSQCCYCWFFIA